MKQSVWVGALSLAFLGSSLAHAHGVTNAKAIELALHRVERLVILKKIDKSFLSELQSFQFTAIPHETEEEPAFKVTVKQYPAQDQTQKAVDIVLDEEGRPLSFAAQDGGAAANAPAWLDKNAVTLTENSLHWVIETAVTKPEIALYNSTSVLVELAQVVLPSGDKIAALTYSLPKKDGKEQAKLLVRMKPDATFDSAEILPTP